jgi:HlyD family secretion protein
MNNSCSPGPPARTRWRPSARSPRSPGAGLQVAKANLESAEQELNRVRAEREALVRQRANLRLIAPVDALVVSRDAEPGSTLVAGQSVVEVIDAEQLWVNARFDQLGAGGLAAGLPARISLRSQPLAILPGEVGRVEPGPMPSPRNCSPRSSSRPCPTPLPRLGELAEVTVLLAPLPPTPWVPNAALHRRDGQLGVWRLEDGRPASSRWSRGWRTWTAGSRSAAGLSRRRRHHRPQPLASRPRLAASR